MDGSVNVQPANPGLNVMDNQAQEGYGGDNAMLTGLSPRSRYSTSRKRLISERSSLVSRVSTIFTPRKKLTSFSAAPGSSLGNFSRPNASETTASIKDAVQDASTSAYHAAGGITRKGFEPVGHTAKSPRKRRSISILGKFPNKTGGSKEAQMTMTSMFPASGNVFSSSSVSLAMHNSPQSKSKKERRASVSAGERWHGLQLVGAHGYESGDEIDEIRRPSDLGPEAEVMGEELHDCSSPTGLGEKPLPGLPMEATREGDACLSCTRSHPASPCSSATSPVAQAISNPQIIAHTLHFLPKRSEVARLATISCVFLVAARRILYGCVDLRLNVDTSSQGDHAVDNKQARKIQRKALGKTLECLVGYSLQERNGELFQDTWGFLMDEWPHGWFESDEIGDDDETNSVLGGDAESQYTAYSDSDLTSNSPSASQLSLDAPHQTSCRRSSTSLCSSNLPERRYVHRQERRERLHVLLKTLLASVPSLTTLMLPAFELGILKYHTAFGLKEVTFLNRRMADWEKEGMLGWLDGIVGVLGVRLPRLIEGDGDVEEETTVDEVIPSKSGDVDDANNQQPVVKVKVNLESADESQREVVDISNADDSDFPPRKKKRKTLLIISPSPDSSAPSSPPVPNFPGTSFPMPPMSPVSASLSTPTTARPISMLFPYLTPPSPVTPSPPSPLTSTPQRPGTLTPERTSSRTSSPITPLTPITPMTPVTPFTPGFYLHSLESSSSSALVASSSPDIEMKLRQLGKKETLLPALEVLHGPPSLVALLVPRRRKTVREVRLNVHGTIVGGQVKMAQVVKGLVRRSSARADEIGLGIDMKGEKESVKEKEMDEGQIQTLAFHFTRSVDRRTMEKVLASAGSAVYRGERGGKRNVDHGRDQGVDTLEIIAACTGHPNSRKSDEAMYKTIHAVLPRYRSLHNLVMRLADPETGDLLHTAAPITRHTTLSLTSLISSHHESTINITNPAKSSGIIDTPQFMIPPSLPPSGNGCNYPHTQIVQDHCESSPCHPPASDGLASPLDQVAGVFTFPRMASPPPPDVASPALSAGSIRSLEIQKLRDRKMMRRFGSVSQRSDSLVSANSSLCPPRSILTSISSRPSSQDFLSINGHHGHQDYDDESDQGTIHSSTISHKNKSVSSLSRSLKRAGSVKESIRSLKKFQSLHGLSIMTATKAIAQVVTTRATNNFRTRSTSSTVGSDPADVDANANTFAFNQFMSPTTCTGTGTATRVAVKPLEESWSSRGEENGNGYLPGSENAITPSLPTTASPDVKSTPNDSSSSVLTSSQRRHISAWRKQCSSLSRVLFVNGAVWERNLFQS
ncbi:hypothetical protein E1B28_013265 [Marasmius oreades]|uniref:Uncharacterized protein n=1 Tax=Marasmius oreades TaxID=181124 RepID=A0A9P7ULW1_9AGAR|nr:uncharacterized protein E1B28_013265 [Marasmius oreades]KAG7087287.1 hypothetical protein E1B28_013265 [Marasmius oreades]